MAKPSIFHRSNLEYWALVAEIVSGVAVMVSLIFVGLQLRDANRVAARAEANSTQEQWTAMNASIYGDAETASIFEAALSGSRPLDAVERLRFAYLLREQGWLTYQMWERTRTELLPRSRFEEGAGPDLARIVCTPGGRMAWPEIRREFPPSYVADLERLMPAHARETGAVCPPAAG